MPEAFSNEGYKTEIINGKKIIMMSPPFSNHNVVKGNIYQIFRSYLRGNICIVFPDGQKLVLENNDGYVVPDLFVLCDRAKFKKDGVYGAPDLVVEIISPRSRKYDRGDKKDLYQNAGVGEYWIVEPDERSIEVYLLKDGLYVLDGVYRIPDEKEDAEDKEKEPKEFKVNLFQDMTVSLDDVFENVVLNWSTWGM